MLYFVLGIQVLILLFKKPKFNIKNEKNICDTVRNLSRILTSEILFKLTLAFVE